MNRRAFIGRVIVGSVALLLLTGSSTIQVVEVPSVPTNIIDQLNSVTLQDFQNYVARCETNEVHVHNIFFEFFEDTFGVYNVGFGVYNPIATVQLTPNDVIDSFDYQDWFTDVLYARDYVPTNSKDVFEYWRDSHVDKWRYYNYLLTI